MHVLRGEEIRPAGGSLAVLIPGLGAVATTFIAGVIAVRRGIGRPFGSVTQMNTLRLGRRTADRAPLIREFLPLASLDNLVFGGWDVFEDNALSAARKAAVLDDRDLAGVADELASIRPMPAVFDTEYVKRIDGPNRKTGTRWEMAQALRDDIRRFMADNGCSRAVMVWCASTEAYRLSGPVHQSLEAFESGLRNDDPTIAPSQIYCYAALMERVPFANGAPNVACEIPALVELARKNRVPVAGKDFKTGQTLMKTVLAPGFKARMIGVSGWFSTNILGNRDGEVLDDPESFRTKEVSKLGVLDTILQPEMYPELYGNLCHKVRINYYPPRGDNKESWDNIDIFGWLGYPMQIKVNFLCRDSILAAPVVLDVALLMDLAARCDMWGYQEWLSFFWKSPYSSSVYAEHDLFIQQTKLKNMMRWLMKEDLITHLGLEYYDWFESDQASDV